MGLQPLHKYVSDTWATITGLIEEAESSLLIATYNVGLSKDCRESSTSWGLSH